MRICQVRWEGKPNHSSYSKPHFYMVFERYYVFKNVVQANGEAERLLTDAYPDQYKH